jgi:hypothetical protein
LAGAPPARPWFGPAKTPSLGPMKKASLVALLALPVLGCTTAAPRADGPAALAPAAPATPAAPETVAREAPARAPTVALATRAPGEFRFALAGPEERVAAVDAMARLPSGWPRIREATAAFLGTPYGDSPLGEGAGGEVDRDPRVRYDAVDCVTFVETSLALGNAPGLADAERLLDEIRYKDGERKTFATRLHIFEAQWIPEQIRRGYVVDITRSFAGIRAKTAAIEFTPEKWAARRALADLAWEDAPHGTFELPFVPLALARERAQELPEGAILNVVREERPGLPTIVSHTGFVVVKDGLRFLRHAALGPHAVTDEPIESFLARHAAMQSWKVRGVNLLAVRDNAAHAREVLARDASAAR